MVYGMYFRVKHEFLHVKHSLEKGISRLNTFRKKVFRKWAEQLLRNNRTMSSTIKE